MDSLAMFAQTMYTTTSSEGNSPFSPIFSLIILALAVVVIVGMWKVFTKAGRPGWASIIPFYNTYVLAEIGGRPGWFGLLASLIPFAGTILLLFISIDVARSFGRSTLFGVVGLWIFGFIGYPMLGFGKYTFRGPQHPLFGESESTTPSGPLV